MRNQITTLIVTILLAATLLINIYDDSNTKSKLRELETKVKLLESKLEK